MSEHHRPVPRLSRRALLRGGALAGGLVVAAGAVDEAAVADPSTPPSRLTDNPAIGPTWPDARLREARVLWRADTDRRVVALTFDDGPMPDYTAAVLAALRRLDVRATFNLVGRRVVAHPDLVTREIGERHEVGNHTFGHVDLARADAATIRSQLHRAHEVIERAAGVAPRLLRPPYGYVSGDSLVAAAELGYDVVSWSVKFHEDKFDAAGNADYVAANLVPGAVVLMHDTGNRSRLKDLEALPGLVARARDAGYDFLTVSELLALSAPGRR